VLILSLDSSPLDGALQNHPVTEETRNNVEHGITKSEQSTDLEAAVTEAEIPPELVEENTQPAKRVTTPVQQITSSQTDAVEDSATDPLATAPSLTTLPEKEAKQLTDDALLTKLPTTASTALNIQPVVTRVQASDSEQQMLNSKLTEIVANLDNLEEMPDGVDWEVDGQHYTASLQQVTAENEMGLPEILVTVKTEMDGAELTTEMSMKQLAFSNFAQFVHRWDSDVQIHDDQLDGRFHSNSRINLEFGRHSGPVFHGKVTTASYRVNMNRHSRRTLKKNVFLGGLETGVKKIPMPQPSMLYFDDTPKAEERRVHFDTDTRIMFQADGSFSAQALTGEDSISQQQIGTKPLYISASEGTVLYLQGTVNGQVLVYSPKHITIEGDLVYADRSGSDQNDDFLGLVSGRNFIIAAPSVTGRGDLHIDASIYAKGRFLVRNYRATRSGTLVIFGSVSAGSMSATEPRYATKITFDPRLEDRRPPNFPTTGRYEIQDQTISWSSSTR